MAKKFGATDIDHRREIRTCVRWSTHEYMKVLKDSAASGASTPSAYIRAKLLTGDGFKVPAWQALWEVRNAVRALGDTLRETGLHTRATEAAILKALDRISRF